MDAAGLIAAYRATRYVVLEGQTTICVRIGCRSSAMDALLGRRGSRTGVFITAWNPQSRPVALPINRCAGRRLEAALAAQAIAWLPQLGVGDDPNWPPEPGALALDLPADAAQALALRFGQNAVVRVARNDPARLVATPLLPLPPAWRRQPPDWLLA